MIGIWIVRVFLFGFVVWVWVVASPSEPCHGSLGGEPVYTCESELVDVQLPPEYPDECQLIYGMPCP